jgi:hypothetical protein
MSFIISGLNGIVKIDNFDMWNFGKEKHTTLHTKSLEGIPYISTLSHIYICYCQSYLLLSKLDIRESDLPRVFARWGWNQYTWKESKFNQLFRGSISVPSGFDKIDDGMMYQESKYQKILDQFMDDNPENDQILFCKEITKMHLCGMTYREIRSLTGISLDTIHKAIKKFKNDLNNYACLNWDGNSGSHWWDSESMSGSGCQWRSFLFYYLI